MASFLRALSRTLRIGNARHFIGKDLEGNSYYEFPPASGSTDPRHTRRVIKWSITRDYCEYDQSSIPVQWTMWLRHTRRSAPTIEELQADLRRRQITAQNAAILAAREAEAKALREQERLQALGPGASTTLPTGETSHSDFAPSDVFKHAASSFAPLGTMPRSKAAKGLDEHGSGRQSVAVPTSDVAVDEERKGKEGRIVGEDEHGREERMPDSSVWEASRRRLHQQGTDASTQAPTSSLNSAPPSSSLEHQFADKDASDPFAKAKAQRAANRATKEKEREEMDRRRRELNKSPLEAFVPMQAASPASGGKTEGEPERWVAQVAQRR